MRSYHCLPVGKHILSVLDCSCRNTSVLSQLLQPLTEFAWGGRGTDLLWGLKNPSCLSIRSTLEDLMIVSHTQGLIHLCFIYVQVYQYRDVTWAYPSTCDLEHVVRIMHSLLLLNGSWKARTNTPVNKVNSCLYMELELELETDRSHWWCNVSDYFIVYIDY